MDKRSLELSLDMLPKELLSDDKKQEILDKSEVLFEFSTYLKNKHNIDDKEAEILGKTYVSSRAKEGSLDEIRGLYIEFAKSEGFSKPKELGDSLISLMNIYNSFRK